MFSIKVKQKSRCNKHECKTAKTRKRALMNNKNKKKSTFDILDCEEKSQDIYFVLALLTSYRTFWN